MKDEEIRNIESLKKIREDYKSMVALKRLLPIGKPFLKLFNVDTSKIEEALKKLEELDEQIQDWSIVPDKFNTIFSSIGWIFFERMDMEIAKQAIKISEDESVEKADEFLVDYYSPEWVERRLIWLKFVKGFEHRFNLTELALEDYKAGRYYASILVVLSVIDGWIGELNIVDFNRYGFFSEKSTLIAWDSIAAHPTGLMKLKETFTKSRQMTRNDEITIPYRHGIMHGLDLGYNNKFVAAKCWATLFVVREWVIKYVKGEIDPPKLDPKAEKSLWESIEAYRKTQGEIDQLRKWQPRLVTIGTDIPKTGYRDDFPEDSPEQKLVEFLNYWQKNNYGYMSNCFAPMLEMKPVDVRLSFQDRNLIKFELIEITDVTSGITDINIQIELERGGESLIQKYQFRVVCSKENGELAFVKTKETTWGITIWRLAG